jgi:transcriptional regulator with XRE-family HTH domain
VNLKNQLKIYLEKRDITAAQLAKKAGVSKQVISLWLNGGSPRKVDQIKLVADALGTTVDHLCFGTGVQSNARQPQEFDYLPSDEWMSGLFEIKVRRVKK